MQSKRRDSFKNLALGQKIRIRTAKYLSLSQQNSLSHQNSLSRSLPRFLLLALSLSKYLSLSLSQRNSLSLELSLSLALSLSPPQTWLPRGSAQFRRLTWTRRGCQLEFIHIHVSSWDRSRIKKEGWAR